MERNTTLPQISSLDRIGATSAVASEKTRGKECLKAEKSVWLMKCPLVVAKSWILLTPTLNPLVSHHYALLCSPLGENHSQPWFTSISAETSLIMSWLSLSRTSLSADSRPLCSSRV